METTALNYDVVIVGGGVAGIAAALASVRCGKKTLLVESTYLVGGLATNGLVAFYLPIDDGEGHQISYGICEELFFLSIAKGNEGGYPTAWIKGGTLEEKIKKRFAVQFNPQLFGILCEQRLIEEGVKILYGCVIHEVERDGNTIKKIHGSTRTQNIEISGTCFVDCTGDATLAEKAGAPVAFPEHSNVLTGWHYSTEEGKYKLHTLGSCDYIYAEGKGDFAYRGIDSQEVSDFSIAAHRLILDSFLKGGEDSRSYALSTIPSIPDLRMTRRLVGKAAMRKEDNDKFEPHSLGLITSWLERGLRYEMPGESLFSESIDNLYVAGRCISVENDAMWDIVRAIPGCTVSGEACGYLAATFPRCSSIDYQKAQDDLRGKGVKIHLSEVDL